MKLVRLELKRIMRRRGSFYGVIGVAVAIGVLTFALGSHQDTQIWTQSLGIPLVLGSTLVAALAGSYDTSQGTMRYLVLTGEPRWRLVARRVPAMVIAIALMTAAPAAICLVAMLSDHQSASDIAQTVFGMPLLATAWGIVSLAIGTMLRSNGAAIGASLSLFFVGTILTDVVRQHVSEAAGDYLLPNVAAVVGWFGQADAGSPPFTIGLGAAVVALALWLAAFTGLAVARAERDEY
jgi:ABC-type transport system involved in multi-copper enzyme maturation permease subunit